MKNSILTIVAVLLIALGSVENMLKEAVDRLHRAKGGGRNRLVSV